MFSWLFHLTITMFHIFKTLCISSVQSLSSVQFFATSCTAAHRASLSLCAVLWKSVFSWIYLSLSPLLFTSLLPFAIVSPPQITTSPSCFSFSLEWFCLLPPIQYYRPPSIVLHAQCLQSSNPLNLLSW